MPTSRETRDVSGQPITKVVALIPARGGSKSIPIAEIGINHNGEVAIAKQLIDVARAAGCDAVKFQKRTPALCVPPAQRQVMRETPWGRMPYLAYRQRIELNDDDDDVVRWPIGRPLTSGYPCCAREVHICPLGELIRRIS